MEIEIPETSDAFGFKVYLMGGAAHDMLNIVEIESGSPDHIQMHKSQIKPLLDAMVLLYGREEMLRILGE